MVLNRKLIKDLSDATDTPVVRGGADDTVTTHAATRGGINVVDGDKRGIYTLGNATQTVVDDRINYVLI